MRRHRRGSLSSREAGQTLHEVMIIIIALGVLMALVLGLKLLTRTWHCPTTQRETQILINQYGSALLDWRDRHPEAACPATLDELYANGYVNARPVDPWLHPLVYHCPARDGRAWEVYSTGPDRRDGTADDVHPAPR